MLNLPAANSPIRDLFDVNDLATMHRQDVPFLASVTAAHCETMKADKAIKSVNFIALSITDGNVYLFNIGRRGGVRKLWNFGPITGLPI